VIRFTHVDKHYSKGAALKDVSLHIAKGEFVFLTGHSGAGKSTMLKMMFAELMPTSGEVRVSGFNVTEIRPREIAKLRRRLGIVFQDFRLLEDRTAEENVAFALEVTGAHRDVIPSKVMRVLTQVGLAAKVSRLSHRTVGGRAATGRDRAGPGERPRHPLADEPTGNLDERATRGVFQLIREINAGGTCVVMATHDLDLVKQATYRTVEMREGAVVFDSGTDESTSEDAS
jgi:cell division transport system ATP-binding protein